MKFIFGKDIKRESNVWKTNIHWQSVKGRKLLAQAEDLKKGQMFEQVAFKKGFLNANFCLKVILCMSNLGVIKIELFID